MTPVKKGFYISQKKQGHGKASAVAYGRGKGVRERHMKKEAVRKLMDDQRKRFARQKQKEQENSTTEDAKAVFRRRPYYMRQDCGGNDLGGRG